MKRSLILSAAAMVICCSAFAKVELPSVIGSDMVLQQKTDAALWGKAKPGSTVTIKATWTKTKTTVKAGSDGKWMTRIATPSAGGPYEITFSDGEATKISNVMVGEVWFCSGQSNMEMSMMGNYGQKVEGNAEAIMSARADIPIRLYNVKNTPADEPQEACEGEWKENTGSAVSTFSAIGYFFAKDLYAALGVPIGMIEADWGGTPIQTWMDKETLEKCDVATEQPDKRKQDQPSRLYNGMVNPLVPFTFKGMLWYQGESDLWQAEKYSQLQPAYVEMMRTRFQNPDAAFYYVQIAPYKYRYFDTYQAPVFQQMQTEMQDKIPHSGMAGTEDIGTQMVIHPFKKKEVGDRLAWLALTNDYGVEGVDPYVPRYESVRFEDGKAFVTFDTKRGLSPYRLPVPGFEIAGADKVFHEADAIVLNEGDYGNCRTVRVSCPDVPEPVAVRYCFHDWTVGTLTSTYGIPVPAFRTDSWDVIKTSE